MSTSRNNNVHRNKLGLTTQIFKFFTPTPIFALILADIGVNENTSAETVTKTEKCVFISFLHNYWVQLMNKNSTL